MSATALLQKYFGYSTFRTGQEALIRAILSQQDTLGIMPTGAGKSICYQIPALMLDGITLVVSPLISLMQDQVQSLQQLGIRAAFINSSLSNAEQEDILLQASTGTYQLLYVAPERLLSTAFLSFAQQTTIAMLTIDEAHCVSQWGQNFRPSYLDIVPFIDSLPKRPVISAFTATATGRVKEDIISLLQLHEPAVFVTGFDRENLYFSVEAPRKKSDALLSFLRKHANESGIIYCNTRKNVETICALLQEKGFSAARYHAGLSATERADNQSAFLFDRIQIMVATNAFGMGIDKSNVSFVVHYNMPKDLESYYQEAGRAGRDGSPADCVLLYSGQDVVTNQRLIQSSTDASAEQTARELERLKQMTFYATSNTCLRAYILTYFGENPPTFCGHCSNCDTKFETVDITIDAQKIISCIIRAGSRFGATMIVDILRGAKNERLVSFGLDKLSTYGISEKSASALHTIINHLLQEGYLQRSDGQFPVLQHTAKATPVLKGLETITAQLPKEKEERAATSVSILSPEALALYDILKNLRNTLAEEKHVPAYVVFSNKVLSLMCESLPQTRDAFLSISGVGELKAAQYGAVFTEAIAEFCATHEIQPAVPVETAQTTKKRTAKTKEVHLPSPEILAEIKPSPEPIAVSVLTQKINDVLLAHECTKLSPMKTANWLIAQGYLQIVTTDNRTTKAPTDFGTQQGILLDAREHNGTSYCVNLYPEALQTYIIAHICDIQTWVKPE